MDERTRGPLWFERVGRASWLMLGIAGAIVVIGLFLNQFASIVTPLVLAVFMAIGFIPAVDWLERRKVSRSAGALIVLLGVIAIVVGAVAMVIVGVSNNAGELSASLSKAANQLTDLTNNARLGDSLNKLQDNLFDIVRQGFTSGAFGNAIGSVAGVLSGLFIGTMLLYYLLRDGESIVRSAVSHRQPGHTDRYAEVLQSSIRRIRGFLAGTAINAAAQGLAVGLGMWLLGVPLPLAIGIVIFLTAFVPYVGAFIGGFFAVAMGLSSGGVPTALASLAVVVLGSGVLQNLLTPVLTGNRLNLHPIVVLLVTVAGGVLAGLVGFILAAPTAAIVRDIYVQLRDSGFFDDRPDTNGADRDDTRSEPATADSDAAHADAADSDAAGADTADANG